MKKLLFFSLFISISYFSNAQDFLGYSASEYAGVTAIDIQPANLADNRFRFDMTLGAFSIKAYNNYFGIKRYGLQNTNSGLSNYSPLMSSSAYNADQVKSNFYETDNGPRGKSVYLSNRIVLPSFLLEIDHKNSIALTWDVRNFVNVDNVTPELANLLYTDFQQEDLLKKDLSVKNLSVQAMSWAEYGITYARVLKEDNEHAFKAAGRIKAMQGIAAAYLYAKNFQFSYPSDTTMNILNTEVEYGHSNNLYGNNELKYKWVSNPGIGFDLGLVYEWRPDYAKYKYDLDGEKNLWRRDLTKYKFKAGISILDIGGVKFTKGQYSHNFKANVNFMEFRKKFDVASSGLIVGGDTSQLNFNSLDDSLMSLGTIDDSKRTFVMNLPTAISVQADYRIWKDFDINFIGYYAFQFKNNAHKVHDFSSLSITPCWDHKWFGVFLPFQYHFLYGWAYGACVRLGPIIVGTDNLGAFVGNKTLRGADAYFLLKIPIPFGPPKDKDKDGVSNKKDLCKTVPGLWEFQGCPDRDGDKIQDKLDKCPDVAGLPELQGCPDKDGDKITDAEDNCPEIAGLLEFKGCPDTDGDKIIDSEDKCPELAGTLELKGCPDTDKDGLTDDEDECDDIAGPLENKGCPWSDKDNDSIPDKDDVCPDLAGPRELKGCPDTDRDGLTDPNDKCPEVAGPAENNGCPWLDSDSDGVIDIQDSCVTIPGDADNFGCPKIKEEEKHVIEEAFSHLEFASGKEIIRKTSYPTLNDLARILKEHSKDWTLKLSGHTDNAGTPESNMLLSEKRAKAVMKYLVSKGVNSGKIVVEWFGQTQPIADNTTEEGRQKNRRVNMTIITK